MGARRESELHGLADNLRAAVGYAAEDGEWAAAARPPLPPSMYF